MLCMKKIVFSWITHGRFRQGRDAVGSSGWMAGQAGCGMEEIMRELDYGRVGMRIRQVRKVKGWSQDELARKCGISMSFLGHIERGTRIMSLETFVNICGALEADADELLWGEVHPSDAVLDLWGPSGQRDGGKCKDADSYALYVKIMKSVAEIINEA